MKNTFQVTTFLFILLVATSCKGIAQTTETTECAVTCVDPSTKVLRQEKVACHLTDPQKLDLEFSNMALTENDKTYLQTVFGEIKSKGYTIMMESHYMGDTQEVSELKMSKNRGLAVYDYLESVGMLLDNIKLNIYGNRKGKNGIFFWVVNADQCQIDTETGYWKVVSNE